jgi:alkylated DNA repair dioxygenase AlkB
MAVAGFTYVARHIIEQEEGALLAAVDAEPWLTELKRRVQHYGYRYDYKARKVDPAMYLGPLPGWALPVAARLVAKGHMPGAPDQLIVNEYEPGQGITPHVDCVPCFGPVICSLTLGSSCVMELSAVEDGGKATQLLERGSLLVLARQARYEWRHAIPGRKTDEIDGRKLSRGRRVSLTFRTVIVEGRGGPA